MKAEDLDYSKSNLFVVAENLYWPEMDQIRSKSFSYTFFTRVSFFVLGKLEDFLFDFVEELVRGRQNESKNKF